MIQRDAHYFAVFAELHGYEISESALEPLAAGVQVTYREFEMMHAIEKGNIAVHGRIL
jgi:hypothetical protein